MLTIIFLLIFLIFWIFCFEDCTKPWNFPPGPQWYPFVGCFPTFQKFKKKFNYIHLIFEELSVNYGPILGIKLGRQKIVIISGNNLIRKNLMKQEFTGRPDGFFFRVRSFGKRKGILFTDGTSWYQTKKMTMKYLSNFGFGHSAMTDYLKLEAEILIKHFQSEINNNGSNIIAMNKAFDVAVLNTLWTMMAGYRFSYEDNKLHDILSTVHEAFRSNDTLGGIISHLPFLRFIIPGLSGYTNLMKVLNKLWGFIAEEIDNHVKTLNYDQQPKNLIDAYLLQSLTKDSAEKSFDREELIVVCLDLFMAGSKTTTDSLTAIFALLIHHPDWMEILKNDLDKVLGDNPPSIEYMNLLPRVEAFLSEAHRVLVLTPLGVPHRTMEDVSLEGYYIPKDTVVLFNYHTANTDESCWEKPYEFNPQRFLDENGKYRRRNDFIVFGLGKRRCLGEVMARQTLFLFFTYILHYFHLEVPKGHDLPRLDGIDGFVVSPRPYLLNLIPRRKINFTI